MQSLLYGSKGGNSFKVYDYVDSVTQDSELAGKLAAEYIKKGREGKRREDKGMEEKGMEEKGS